MTQHRFYLKQKLSYFSLLFPIGAARNSLIKPESWGQHTPGDTMTGSQNNRNKPLPFLSVLVSGWGTAIELVPNCPRGELFWKEVTLHKQNPLPFLQGMALPNPIPRSQRPQGDVSWTTTVVPVITAHTFTAWTALTEGQRTADATITSKSWLLWMRVNVFMNKIQMFYHLRTQASCYKEFMNCYAVYEHSSIGTAFPVLLALSAGTAHRYFPLTDSPCPG